MFCYTRKIAIALRGAVLVLAVATVGHAQTSAPQAPAPVFPAIDANGVDVSRGAFTYSQTDVVIGQPGSGGLAFTRYYQSAPVSSWTHNHNGYLSVVGSVCSVVIGAFTETFTASVANCRGTITSNQMRGSSLTYNTSTFKYTYTSDDGTVAVFNGASPVLMDMATTATAYLASVTTPSGEVTTYTYDIGWECFDQQCAQITRLARVSNNFGYHLAIEYPAANGTLLENYSAVTGVNLASEYCTGANCPAPPAGQQPWPRVTYGYRFYAQPSQVSPML